MKRSSSVVMGSVVAAAVLVCCGWGVKEMLEPPSGPTGDYDELCVDENDVRVPDEYCDDPNHPNHGSSHMVYMPYHHGRANPAYPVGSKVLGASSIKPSSGNFVRGGLGGFRGSGGG